MFGAITQRSLLACSSNQEKKSLIVVQSFGVQIVCMHHLVFECFYEDAASDLVKINLQ